MTDADLPLEYEFLEGSGETETPAVVVLHGRGADHHDLLPVADRLPDELAVLSLRAPEPLHGGFTWYALDLPDGDLHRSQPDPDDFARSLDLLRESVAVATDQFDLDADRIGLFGFSQGAIMSVAALVERPDAYAWVVGLHGYLPASHADRDVALDDIPVFIGAGSTDEIIPADRSASAAERLQALGADVTHRVYDAPHGIGREELADVVDWVDARLD